MKSLKTLSGLAISIAVLLIFAGALYAQDQTIQTFRFKDGTVIKGRILQMNTDIVKIETADGKTVVRKFDEFEGSVDETPAPDRGRHAFDLALMYSYFDYKEDIAAPGKSTESGWLPGILVSYTFNKKSGIYTRILSSYSAGNLTYDGTTQGGTPITFSDNPQHFYRFEWDVGYNFALGDRFSLIPYIGYGYRYWSRGEAKITPTYISYKEIYQWHYIPVGLKAAWDIDERVSVGASVAANFMFSGKMRAELSQVEPGFEDPNVDLGNKIGYYAEIPVKYKFTPHWALTVTPWYEYSEIGQSGDQFIRLFVPNNRYYIYSIHEPSSKTSQYGVNCGVSYSF